MPMPSAAPNKGAPGVDGQDFADIEAYGVERWLAELALALREETYRPEPKRSESMAPGGGPSFQSSSTSPLLRLIFGRRLARGFVGGDAPAKTFNSRICWALSGYGLDSRIRLERATTGDVPRMIVRGL
jgi:hypothetical protein